MSSKITNQIVSLPDRDLPFNDNKELLNQLTDYELLKVYNTLYHIVCYNKITTLVLL